MTLIFAKLNRAACAYKASRMRLFYGGVAVVTIGALLSLTFGLSHRTAQADVINTTDFVTTWRITNPGDTSITIPTNGAGYNYNVDWNNDGIAEQTALTGNVTHNFGAVGDFTIRISGVFPWLYNSLDSTNAKKLIDVNQWGSNQWGNMSYAFAYTGLTTLSATDAPDLSLTTDMTNMFYNASTFNSNISAWDTSKVTYMSSIFYDATAFNGDVSGWDTSKATNMSYMFYRASAFNQDISGWITSNVTDMSRMFYDAKAFNQDISTWNTSNVTNMSNMFYNAKAFNKNLSGWDTSKVTNMYNMFSYANTFNGTISGWNTSNVTSMSSMFNGATAFNQDISGWITSNVTDMSSMFNGATVFNQDISGWDISKVTDMSYMFWFAQAFNQNISSWNTSNVTTMSNMFYYANVFNGDISSWNTAKVTNMSSMFYNAQAFNKNLSGWDTSKVTNMYSMFSYAKAFNGNISGWNTSSVANMSYMFSYADVFNGDISSWNTANVTNMAAMFTQAKTFNQDISRWDTSKVVDMSHMFSNTEAFNQDISSLNTANVTNMYSMFSYAKAFNQNLSAWNTSSVTNMSSMFSYTGAFNGDIAGWNTSNVTNMADLFNNAKAFNKDIATWDTSKVTNMSWMFNSAPTFNQSLASWDVSSVTTMSAMLSNGNISTANYDATLSGWASRAGLRTGVNLGASGLIYCTANTSRQLLITNFSWNISQDNQCAIPLAPSALVATPSSYEVQLSWTKPYEPKDTITDYKIEYSSDSGATWHIQTHAPSAATAITVTGLTPKTSYSFRVSAINGRGTGAVSSVVSAATTSRTPDAPSGLASVPSPRKTELSWTAPALDGGETITNYVVEYSSDAGATWHAVSRVASGTPSQTVSDLSPNTNYRFRVAAINSKGMGDYSSVISSRTLSSAPDAPQALVATGAQESVTLHWQAPTDNGGQTVTNYTIEYSTDNQATWVEFEHEPSTETHATVDKLFLPALYYFRVTAINNAGQSISSQVAQATPIITPTTASITGQGSLEGSDSLPKRPTFSGTTIPFSSVTVTVHSDPISCSTTSGSDGKWSCTLPRDVEPGSHTVLVAIVLPDNTTRQIGPYTIVVAQPPVSTESSSSSTSNNQPATKPSPLSNSSASDSEIALNNENRPDTNTDPKSLTPVSSESDVESDSPSKKNESQSKNRLNYRLLIAALCGLLVTAFGYKYIVYRRGKN